MNKRLLGFTLIELLVSISVIIILMGVLYANFGETRAESRDKIRQSDLKGVQLALELYKAQYDVYPEEGCGSTAAWTGPGPHSAAWGYTPGCDDYIAGLAPDFIAALPKDPAFENEDNRGYLYMVNATRTGYKLLANQVVEVNFVTDYNDEFARCRKNLGSSWCGVTPQSDTYAVYSVGGEDF